MAGPELHDRLFHEIFRPHVCITDIGRQEFVQPGNFEAHLRTLNAGARDILEFRNRPVLPDGVSRAALDISDFHTRFDQVLEVVRKHRCIQDEKIFDRLRNSKFKRQAFFRSKIDIGNNDKLTYIRGTRNIQLSYGRISESPTHRSANGSRIGCKVDGTHLRAQSGRGVENGRLLDVIANACRQLPLVRDRELILKISSETESRMISEQVRNYLITVGCNAECEYVFRIHFIGYLDISLNDMR